MHAFSWAALRFSNGKTAILFSGTAAAVVTVLGHWLARNTRRPSASAPMIMATAPIRVHLGTAGLGIEGGEAARPASTATRENFAGTSELPTSFASNST